MTIMEVGIFSGFAPDKDSLFEVDALSAFCHLLLVRRPKFYPGNVLIVPFVLLKYFQLRDDSQFRSLTIEKYFKLWIHHYNYLTL